MSFSFSSHEHQRSLALLLAATVSDFVPILTPIQGSSSPTGFYYDFLSDQKVDETLLTLITEEMRRKIQQQVGFERITMMPKNAANFIEERQPILAAFLEAIDSNLVDLAKCGQFYDITLGDTVEDVRELREFLLYKIEEKCGFYEPLGEVSIVRIWGAGFTDRKSTKNYVKMQRAAEVFDPVEIASKKGLVRFFPEFVGTPFWLSEGVSFCQKVKGFWQLLCQKQEIEQVYTHPDAIEKAHELLIRQTKTRPFRIGEWTTQKNDLLPQDYEGLCNTSFCQTDRIKRVVAIEEVDKEVNSSLQFMQELLSMLGLDFRHILLLPRNGNELQEKVTAALVRMGIDFAKEETKTKSKTVRLELRASDSRAREWTLATLEVAMLAGPEPMVLLSQISFVSVERALALLLEKRGNINI